MKITSVEMTAVAVPYRPEVGPVVTAGLTMTEARHLIVQVHTDEGLTGLGEAVPRPSTNGETLQSIATAIDDLLIPPILGLDPVDIEKVWGRWARVTGNMAAKAALDIALHDLAGKRAGLPLYQMLGGWADARIPLTMPIAIGDKARMVSQAEQAVERGFHGVKVKVGKNLQADIQTVGAIRKAIGDNLILYPDANQGYTPAEAMRAIREFEAFGIALAEEPIAVSDTRGRAALARAIHTPLLLDQSVHLPSDAMREIHAGTAGAISLKSPHHGFSLAQRIVHLAEAANIPCLIGSSRELGIGTVASAHLAGAFRNMAYPAELAVYLLVEDGLLAEPLRIEGGYLYLPSGPGLGVALDPKKVARYRI